MGFLSLISRMLSYTPFLAIGLVLWSAAWAIYTRFFHPLKDIPGPFWASFSHYWLFSTTMNKDMAQVQRALHAKHGPLVRISPNQVACADPDAIRVIYSTQNPLEKSDFYAVFNNKDLSKYPDHFSCLDEKLHTVRRKVVNNVYSLTSVLKCEPYIDKCTRLFMKRLGELADKGNQSIDFGEWILWYAFDVIGELYFGNMFGFMEHSHDHKNYISAFNTVLPILCALAIAPSYWRPVIIGSALFQSKIRKALGALEHITQAARECVATRIEQNKTDPGGNDLLQQLLDIVNDRGAKVDFGIPEVQTESYVALVAGSDTTAIALRSTFYNLLTNPSAYSRLQEEIDAADKANQLSEIVQYAEAAKLPYLCACIKEGMRLHSSTALTLQRYAPKGGIEVSGKYIAEGYRIGVNAGVIQFDKTVYGADAEIFRPDRWLEGDVAAMERCFMNFGTGTRTCLGKNIAYSEMYKIVPQILRNFTLELAPDAKWETQNVWFHQQTGLRTIIKRR